MFDRDTLERIGMRLAKLYGKKDAGVPFENIKLLPENVGPIPQRARAGESLWTEADTVLITYGDQVYEVGSSTLATLGMFFEDHAVKDIFSIVHILPFFPYSSDDGFSVINYAAVNPSLGDWEDIRNLGEDFHLMFDLVVNHCSQGSEWFQGFLKGEERFQSFFITVDPETDLSQVTRPRSLPLLTPFETAEGTKHVWTTFSADQVDLNFASPAVLLDMLKVLLLYVQQGGRIIRLDAIAYLWKEIGTSCIHLPQTHEVVKLMRDLVDAVAPGTILLTETNVPHAENVSYFGDGDEAQMVYQFSLAPLLLDALLSEDATPLNDWLTDLEPPRPGTTYFNFTASHDGIGVRPLEGLLSSERRERLVDAVLARGGQVSTKRNADGTDSPYELNITYFSALGGEDVTTDEQITRFLTSQAVMLSLQGMPGIYFHSLIGTPNFTVGVEQTGRARTINRRKFERSELESVLADEEGVPRRVLEGYRRLLAVRRSQPAFHPDANQRVLTSQDPAQIAFVRTSVDEGQQVLVLVNCSGQPTSFSCEAAGVDVPQRDLLNLDANAIGETIEVPAYGVRWLG